MEVSPDVFSLDESSFPYIPCSIMSQITMSGYSSLMYVRASEPLLKLFTIKFSDKRVSR